MNLRKVRRMTLFTETKSYSILYKSKYIFLFPFLFTILVLNNCSSTHNVETVTAPGAIQTACSDMPAVLLPGCEKLYREGWRNWVLNSMDLGLLALQNGYIEIAAQFLDEAMNGIEAVYANNENAIKARGLWREEGSKDFKGEPYERAMAFYYRGIVDLMNNDLENARACFRGGSLQDAFAEEEQNRCDMALLIFLQGWCSNLLRDFGLRDSAYEEVGRLRNNFQIPNPQENVLFLLELGNAPRKRTDGIGHAQLKFFRGKNLSEDNVKVLINGNEMSGYAMESIYWQAASRGARPIDFILDGQVHFKETTFDIGRAFSNEVTSFYGTVYAGTDIGTAANALGLVGGIAQLFASNVKPKADARYWQNLPDSVHVITAELPSGNHTAEFVFYDEFGEILSDLSRFVHFDVKTDTPNLIWLHLRE